MRTSYFYGPHHHDEAAVSIALSPPYKCSTPYQWRANGRLEYMDLAPSKALFKNWSIWRKRDLGEAIRRYVVCYTDQLDRLSPEIVYDELIDLAGDDPILMCYEKPGMFCHRHLAGKWIEENLGIKVMEAGQAHARPSIQKGVIFTEINGDEIGLKITAYLKQFPERGVSTGELSKALDVKFADMHRILRSMLTYGMVNMKFGKWYL